MRRLQRRTAPSTAVGRPAARALASGGAVVLLLAGTTAMRPAPTGPGPAGDAVRQPVSHAPASATTSSVHTDHLAGPARDRAVRPVRAAAGQSCPPRPGCARWSPRTVPPSSSTATG